MVVSPDLVSQNTALPDATSSTPGPIGVHPKERRRHQRVNVHISAMAEFPNGSQMPVCIINISTKGLGLDRPLPCRVDDRVVIAMPSIGRFDARVAWTSEVRAGVELLRDLHTVSQEHVEALANGLAAIEPNRA